MQKQRGSSRKHYEMTYTQFHVISTDKPLTWLYLVSMLLRNLTSCDVCHDLMGAAAEHIAAQVSPNTADANLLGVAKTAVDGQSLVCNLEALRSSRSA